MNTSFFLLLSTRFAEDVDMNIARRQETTR